MDLAHWFGHVLRFARRDIDMSQRELARWSGVPKSTIADIEAEHSNVSLLTAFTLLSTMGYQLIVHDPLGKPVDEFYQEWRRDCVGRRLPAHLDMMPKPDDVVAFEAKIRQMMRQPPPTRWTFHLNRDRRDLHRVLGYHGELGGFPRPPSVPLMFPLWSLVKQSRWLSAVADPFICGHPTWGPEMDP